MSACAPAGLPSPANATDAPCDCAWLTMKAVGAAPARTAWMLTTAKRSVLLFRTPRLLLLLALVFAIWPAITLPSPDMLRWLIAFDVAVVTADVSTLRVVPRFVSITY